MALIFRATVYFRGQRESFKTFGTVSRVNTQIAHYYVDNPRIINSGKKQALFVRVW